MKVQNIKLDSKGRILIPNSFRDILGIKSGEHIVLELDPENNRLILIPIEKEKFKLELILDDKSGALAAAASIISKNQVDLVHTESRSSKRGKEAV